MVLMSAAVTFLVLVPLLPTTGQVLVIIGTPITAAVLAAKRGYDAAVAFAVTPWRAAARITAPMRRLLPRFAWDMRPIPIAIGAWRSAAEGPAPIGVIGALSLLGIGVLTYVSPWCRKQLGEHAVTSQEPGRGEGESSS
jgi:hypothetical protein